jgi:hypothetical protein
VSSKINHINKMMYRCMARLLSGLLFVLFLLTIVLSVLTFTDFDYPFGILKFFLNSDGETGDDCYEKKVSFFGYCNIYPSVFRVYAVIYGRRTN